MSADTLRAAMQATARPERRALTGWVVVGSLLLACMAVAWAWLPIVVRLALVACLALCLIALAVRFWHEQATLADRATAVAAVAAVIGGLLTGILIAPGAPPPGVPLLTDVSAGGRAVPVLVVPQRPGWNLIHIGATEAAVGLRASELTAAAPRPGASGVWALVRLPAGQVTLLILDNGATARLRLRTGPTASPLPALTGPDGAECASAVLGALVAGQDTSLHVCPSQRLTSADAGALRGIIRFIAGRSIHHVTLVADSSPRSVQAARVVLAACAAYGITAGIPGSHPGGPVVIVSGWTGADAALRQVVANSLPSEGTYLAPWLLDAPLLSYSAGQLLPLRYDPTDPATLRYIDQLDQRFPGEVATGTGYAAWLAATGSAQTSDAHLYAAALIPDPEEIGHSHGLPLTWLPGGALTQVSGSLSATPRPADQ
jgi:hypothetical protein